MKQFKIGLQLYSVRDDMARDLEGTLRAVKEMGYDYVEFAGYFERSAEELRRILDGLGLTCISVHQGPEFYDEGGQSAVDFVKTLGVKYSAIPWYRKEALPGSDAWEETRALFERTGKLLRDNGIRQLYHNHDFEFVKVGGVYKYDIMMDSLPRELFSPELDTCWVKYAGEDPVRYLERFSGHVDLLHLKDFTCKALGGGPAYALIDADGNPMEVGSREDNEFRFRPLGQGMQCFPEILAAAERAGVETLIVEQDASYETPALEAVRESREYLRSLGL